MPPRVAKFVIVGDAGVGKTSLLRTHVTSNFTEAPHRVSHPVTMLTDNNVNLTIYDTSSVPEDRSALDELLAAADVVLVVCAADRPESLASATSYWLPHLRERFGSDKHALLVCTRVDVTPANEQALEDAARRFSFVYSVCCASAKALYRLNDVFWEAERALLYPYTPLIKGGELTPAYRKALTRTFRLFDQDGDGVLSRAEFSEYHGVVFGAQARPSTTVLAELEAMSGAAPGTGFTRKQFCGLHCALLVGKRATDCWIALRTLGYGHDPALRLPLPPEAAVLPPMPLPGQSCQLTPAAVEFLGRVFGAADSDGDGELSRAELHDVFRVTDDEQVPWARDALPGVSAGQRLEREGWAALWAMLAELEPARTLQLLFYLGFPHPLGSALTATAPRSRADDRKKQHSPEPKRVVSRCFLLGSQGCGKTALVRSFLRHRFSPELPSTRTCTHSANLVDGRCLLVTEVPESELALQLPALSESADVLLLAWNPEQPESFEHLTKLCEVLPDDLPWLLVATQEPQDAAREQGLEFATALGLAEPMVVGAPDGAGVEELWRQVMRCADCPLEFLPASGAARLRWEALRRWVVLGVGLGVALGGVGVWLSWRVPGSGSGSGSSAGLAGTGSGVGSAGGSSKAK